MSRLDFRQCAHVYPETGRTCMGRPVPGERYCTGCLWRRQQETAAFDNWLQDVARILDRSFGLYPDDLPDCPYADWHQEGVRPVVAARRAVLRAQGKEE